MYGWIQNCSIASIRVMHGAHEGRFDLPDKGGSTVFFPDRTTRALLAPDDVAAFHEFLGRRTITGKYSRPACRQPLSVVTISPVLGELSGEMPCPPNRFWPTASFSP